MDMTSFPPGFNLDQLANLNNPRQSAAHAIPPYRKAILEGDFNDPQAFSGAFEGLSTQTNPLNVKDFKETYTAKDDKGKDDKASKIYKLTSEVAYKDLNPKIEFFYEFNNALASTEKIYTELMILHQDLQSKKLGSVVFTEGNKRATITLNANTIIERAVTNSKFDFKSIFESSKEKIKKLADFKKEFEARQNIMLDGDKNVPANKGIKAEITEKYPNLAKKPGTLKTAIEDVAKSYDNLIELQILKKALTDETIRGHARTVMINELAGKMGGEVEKEITNVVHSLERALNDEKADVNEIIKRAFDDPKMKNSIPGVMKKMMENNSTSSRVNEALSDDVMNKYLDSAIAEATNAIGKAYSRVEAQERSASKETGLTVG